MQNRFTLKRWLVRLLFAMLVLLPFNRAVAQQPSIAAEIVPTTGHSAAILAVDISPDGNFILSAAEDGPIKLWEARTGRLIRVFKGHEDGTSVLRFFPAGQSFIAGGNAREAIRIHSIATGRLIRSIKAEAPIDTLRIVRNGKVLFLGDEFSARFLDVNTGKVIKEAARVDMGERPDKLLGGAVYDVSTLANRAIVVTNDKQHRSRLVDESSFQLLKEYANSVWSAACFIDRAEKFVATIYSNPFEEKKAGARRELEVLEAVSGKLIKKLSIPNESSNVLCLKGDRIAFLTNRKLRIISAITGSTLVELGDSFDYNGKFAFSEDESRLVYGDPNAPRVELWDVKQKSRLAQLQGVSNSVRAIFPELTNAAVISAGNIVARTSVDTGKVEILRTSRSNINAIDFDQSAGVVGDSEGGIKLFNSRDGSIIKEISINGGVVSVGLLSQLNRIASIGDDAMLRIFDSKTGRELRSFKISSAEDADPTNKVEYKILKSSTLNLFLIEVRDEIWRVQFVDGNVILKRNKSELGWLGKIGAVFETKAGLQGITYDTGTGGQDRAPMQVVSLESGRKKIRDLKELSAGGAWINVLNDGKTFIVGNKDASINVVDLISGKINRVLLDHTATVNSAHLFEDSRRLISGSEDGSFKIWDDVSGQVLSSTTIFPSGEWVTITPEGFFDASSPRAAQSLTVVRGLETSSIDQVYNALYRPDLVREKLAGDPDGKVMTAATKLDLNKVIASGAAPRLSIVTPASGDTVAEDEVTVEASIAEQNGGGIGRIEWRVNGVTLGTESRGLERLPEGSSSPVMSRPTVTVKRTLSLEPGENRIEVVAYNGRDLIASDPARVTLRWDGEKTVTPPKLHVLAVGVNDYYDSRLKLSYAVPDATAFAEGLRKAGAGLYAEVEVTTVLDKDVTILNLDRVFTEVGKKVHPRDVFVFFLAGHGKTKNGRYYFLPRDFRYEDENSIEKTGMDQDKFQTWFAGIPARKSILLYDTCESGSLTGTRARGNDIEERLGALNRMTRATGRTFLTATTDDAPALEGYRGHGVFTYALLDALAHADVNGNGLIEVSELADYIDRKVPDFSFEAFKLRQIPQRSIVGNNFALTNKTAVLAAAGDAPSSGNAKGGTSPPTSDAPRETAAPGKPTHVVVSQSPVDVFIAAARGGAVVQKLPPGTLVTLVETANGWQLIAKDGQKLGFVEEKALARIQ